MQEVYSRVPASQITRTINPIYMYLFGTPEAFIIAQLTYWLQRSNNKRNGYVWVYKTYEEWQNELPFWSVRTIQRAFKKLEKRGVVISDNYNKIPIDKTKWYRINFAYLDELCKTKEVQDIVEKLTGYKRANTSKQVQGIQQNETSSKSKKDFEPTKEQIEEAKKIVEFAKNNNSTTTEKTHDVTKIINYLNSKTGAKYKATSSANRRLILARLNEGYTVQDLKTVIDNQVSAWRGTEWEKYLRPSTLFRASKIENYLNSKRLNHSSRYNSTVQDQYDNLQYTDLSKEDLSGGPF